MPEKLTRKPAKTQQKKPDRFYIGGSDIGCLLGLHPTKGPRDLYNEKLGLVPAEEETALMRKGKTLEPIAAKEFELETGRKLRSVDVLVHPEFSFLQGHADREIVDSGDPWEAKCPTGRRFNRWKSQGLPQFLIAQLIFYIGLKQAQRGVWTIFNSDFWSSANFEFPADPRSFEIMVEVGVKFWINHIEPRVPPPLGIIENPLVEFDVGPGELIKVETPEFLEAMALLRDAKRHVSQATSLELLARERIKEALGDRKGKYLSSAGKLYWTDQKGRRSFDHKRLTVVRPLDRIKTLEVLESTLKPGQLKDVMAALKTCDLDFEEFFTVGEPFEQMRPYFARDEEEDED